MTAFILLAAILLVAAIAFLAWPLLRGRSTGEGAGRAGVAAAVVTVVLPAAAFAIYFAASDWDWGAPVASAPAMSGTALTKPQMESAITGLQAKLAEEPDDIEGWKQLGRSATVIGDYSALTPIGRAGNSLLVSWIRWIRIAWPGACI